MSRHLADLVSTPQEVFILYSTVSLNTRGSNLDEVRAKLNCVLRGSGCMPRPCRCLQWGGGTGKVFVGEEAPSLNHTAGSRYLLAGLPIWPGQ